MNSDLKNRTCFNENNRNCDENELANSIEKILNNNVNLKNSIDNALTRRRKSNINLYISIYKLIDFLMNSDVEEFKNLVLNNAIRCYLYHKRGIRKETEALEIESCALTIYDIFNYNSKSVNFTINDVKNYLNIVNMNADKFECYSRLRNNNLLSRILGKNMTPTGGQKDLKFDIRGVACYLKIDNDNYTELSKIPYKKLNSLLSSYNKYDMLLEKAVNEVINLASRHIEKNKNVKSQKVKFLKSLSEKLIEL